MSILVTGGAGYIGSHTCVELLNAGYEVIVLDNLANSNQEVLKRIEALTDQKVLHYQRDMCHQGVLEEIFRRHSIEAVIHFAGLKAVGESVAEPLKYYATNVMGALSLCEVMAHFNVKKLVFSSSATVYGSLENVPLPENVPLSATNPYGRTKLMIEHILNDIYRADPSWSIAKLRYFNPVGAHPSGLIGEDPHGMPNNLVPFITQVAVGKRQSVIIFGNDYDTCDGTGVRDYVHVMDLAHGHLKALKSVLETTGVEAYNLGTGKGYSVLQMIHAFEKVTGRSIPYTVTNRRPGDVAMSYADPAKAQRILGWTAHRNLEKMCEDAWLWQRNNPDGYATEVPRWDNVSAPI
ncbi:UDP-glucose 4-epimerase [Pullulanibacillus camelliae]|uniref:UDP-glucose 4-epimerase n=1 Tax=Pullulanibacillus camelliae TaxID=1707096 RepID=A0A8J2VKT5_9BACL|nr:UDP-glucose 4-epimerase GalE [Pullulanibacillus camelliae]GGE30566.1 UDP-glucose 4-epimerase [Pullulanibacillus camelliae]